MNRKSLGPTGIECDTVAIRPESCQIILLNIGNISLSQFINKIASKTSPLKVQVRQSTMGVRI